MSNISDMASISPVEATFLWSEPTYEWEEVVSLMRDARSTEAGKYEVRDDMYHTALDVLQIVSLLLSWLLLLVVVAVILRLLLITKLIFLLLLL